MTADKDKERICGEQINLIEPAEQASTAADSGDEKDQVERRYKVGLDRQQPDLLGYKLDDFVDESNPVRAIDAFVDMLDLKQLGFSNTKALSRFGQPAYAPSALLKLYLYSYQNRVRSTRRLACECTRNIEVMWLLEKLTPEYRTIGSFRAENKDAIQGAHKLFIQICRDLELIGGTRVSIDGSHFRGNVSAKSFVKKESLKKRNDEIDKEINDWLEDVNNTDARESESKKAPDKLSVDELREKIDTLKEERDGNQGLLDTMEQEKVNQISRTDADAQRMSKHGQRNHGYSIQMAIDDKNKLIIADDVTNDANDREALYDMAERAKQALDADKLEVLADSGYSSGEQFQKCYDNGITPLVPIMTPRSLVQSEKRYKRADFSYDKERDVYVCPVGSLLHRSGKPRKDGDQIYRSRKADCEQCSKRDQCLTEKGHIRVIVRGKHEELMDSHRDHMKQHPNAMRERSAMVEHPFGTIKVRAGWTHFLLRGKEKVLGEWSLMALCYNLTRVINILGVEKFKQYCNERRLAAC